MTTLWWLLVGHFLGDYVFQTETMALNKRRVLAVRDLQSTPVRNIPWYYWMTAHAMVHGVLVFVCTGAAILAFGEMVCHFAIDCGKCEGFYGHHIDQGFHALCKVTWAILSTGGFR